MSSTPQCALVTTTFAQPSTRVVPSTCGAVYELGEGTDLDLRWGGLAMGTQGAADIVTLVAPVTRGAFVVTVYLGVATTTPLPDRSPSVVSLLQATDGTPIPLYANNAPAQDASWRVEAHAKQSGVVVTPLVDVPTTVLSLQFRVVRCCDTGTVVGARVVDPHGRIFIQAVNIRSINAQFPLCDPCRVCPEEDVCPLCPTAPVVTTGPWNAHTLTGTLTTSAVTGYGIVADSRPGGLVRLSTSATSPPLLFTDLGLPVNTILTRDTPFQLSSTTTGFGLAPRVLVSTLAGPLAVLVWTPSLVDPPTEEYPPLFASSVVAGTSVVGNPIGTCDIISLAIQSPGTTQTYLVLQDIDLGGYVDDIPFSVLRAGTVVISNQAALGVLATTTFPLFRAHALLPLYWFLT
jgi:hypothetical protein